MNYQQPNFNPYPQVNPNPPINHMPPSYEKPSMSGMAITAFVLGIISFSTSFVPIVNNLSAFLALLGVIFGIIGTVVTCKGKKRGKAFGIIALVLNVLAIVLVLASQNYYGEQLDNLAGNPAKGTKGATTAHVGEPLTLDNNLEITVVSVEGGLKNYDGSAITKVVVKYVNNGKNEVSYNTLDWKAENSSGAQTNITMYSDGQLSTNADSLSSGKLAPGGTVSGTMYFKGDVVKMLYSSFIIGNTTATWLV